jgi:hypothetical protein
MLLVIDDFEVFPSVVVPDPVLVMNVFALEERAAQLDSGNEPVLAV